MPKTNKVTLDHTIEYQPPPEPQAELSLDATSYVANENENKQFTILRTIRTDQVVDVDWAITNASVSPTFGTVRFQVGESQQVVQVATQEVNTDEIGSLDLSNPVLISGPASNPILGSPSSATFRVNDLLSSAYPMSKHAFGTWIIGNPQRMWTPTEPSFTVAGICCFITGQLRSMTSNRATGVANYESVHNRNPLIFTPLHQTHPSHRPGYSQEAHVVHGYTHDYVLTQPRKDIMVHPDTNDINSYICPVAKPGSAFGESSYGLNVYHAGLRTFMAQLATDILTGSQLTPAGQGFGDLSNRAGWFYDSTQLLYFGFNKKPTLPLASNGFGTVVSVSGKNAYNVPTTVRIDAQPGAQVAAIGFQLALWPVGKNNGFVIYSIEGYSEPNGTQADLTISGLPGNADTATQEDINAGDGWMICDPDRTSNQWDILSDGNPLNPDEADAYWVPAWKDIWDQLDTFMQQEVGHLTGRGWNALSTSWTVKRNSGWKVPHLFHDSADYPLFENWNRNINCFDDREAVASEYGVQGYDPLEMMMSIHFSSTWVRQPNAFMIDRPRGSAHETLINAAHGSLTDVDASVMRFHDVVIRLSPEPTIHVCILRSGNNGAFIDEHFIDIDTDWVPPEPVIDYFENGNIGLGEFGPFQDATWRAHQWGERGFFRRYGNWIVAINLCDLPAGYGNIYRPSHTSGGWQPRNGSDEITPADWASLYTEGYLQANEVLYYFHAPSYVNDYATAWMRANSLAWNNNHTYAPRGATPSDDETTWNTETCPARAPDTLRYPTNYTLVNQNASLFLGPIEAIWFQIVQV